MRAAMITFAAAFAGNMIAGAAAQQPSSATAAVPALTPAAVNEARLQDLLAQTPREPGAAATLPDPAIVRLQILLDRAGASPGVIDGVAGDNVQKAVLAFEQMQGFAIDGVLDPQVLATLETSQPVIGHYTVTADDAAAVGPPLPEDFSDLAQLQFLGYESLPEVLAERFHMDIDLLAALNPGTGFDVGDRVFVAAYGPDRSGRVARIEADKQLRQLRAYDEGGRLLAAYPATIGSADNPSPSGLHFVTGIAPMPTYTYDPEVNFQQGGNTGVLTLPSGPNGPVGSMWIDLSEPTYGIHGTPDPDLIDKVASHGCVRLTNWDAEELAAMTAAGVPVEFIGR